MFFSKDNRPQPAKLTGQLDTEYVTIAERLKEAGYVNAFLGNGTLPQAWHERPGGEKSCPTQVEVNIGGTSWWSAELLFTIPQR